METGDQIRAGNGKAAEEVEELLPTEGAPPRGDGADGVTVRAARRARELARNAGGKAAFLAEASRLLADSLDYETTLATVAGLALPRLGAWCFVDITEEDGGTRRLAVIHPDPSKQSLARQLENEWPPERDDPFGAPRVMRTLRTEIIGPVTDELLREVARGEENLQSLKDLGMGQLMVVPLTARGEVLGAVTFVIPEGGRPFAPEDVELAEDLAARSAIALDNARLHQTTREALREAERANQAKSLFLTTMSHELRTPINGVVGYAELLEMELHGPLTGKQRDHVRRIQSSSRHLLGLVNEVLDLAKVEAGQMTVRRQQGRVEEAVRSALGHVSPQAELHEVRLENRCEPEGEVEYVADPDRVEQIVTNLVSNAVKFTLPGGGVRVACGITHDAAPEARLAGSGPWAYIVVEDDGIGIAREDHERIFEPFTQVRDGLTRESGGTGLGLALSREMARLMGGDLTLESRLGDGAEFTLWLPTRQRSTPEAPPAGQAMRQADASDRLEVAARGVFDALPSLLDGFLRRVRGETTGCPDPDSSSLVLRDHVASLVTDVIHSVMILAEGGDRHQHLLRDGSKIQRLVAELHGGQRQRLGWTDADVGVEFRILRREIRRVLERVDGLDEEGVVQAAATFDRFIDQAERVSRQGFRAAARAGAA